MKNFLSILTACLLSVSIAGSFPGCSRDTKSGWTIQQSPLMTKWAMDALPGQTWNEYPRPQMERHNWKNFNGLWDYAITSAQEKVPITWTGKIQVPFPIESALSGVMKKVGANEKIWYRKEVKAPVRLKTDRILLHFEAVDWEAKVYIDGNHIGTHRGGYDPFSFDVTDYMDPDSKHELVVEVWDPSTLGYQPVGKQTANPGGIWYTPSSGIWQTVWMEKVPETHISSYRVIPDIDQSEVLIETNVLRARSSDKVEVKVFGDRQLVARETGDAGENIRIGIENQRLWSPDDPFLYKMEINVIRRSKVVDHVKGYFGMRKVSLGKDENGITRMMLNNRFLFQNGPLDQGFWPDGLNTPPSEEAMVYDLEMTRKMGFNMLRKHVKVEPRRFYYHTDKLGILVWQDMPSMYYGVFGLPDYKDSVEIIKANFENELNELVNDHFNSPSIIMWVPFNEGWGQHDTGRIVDLVKSLDNTRLVNEASGWTDHGFGDIKDIHHYPDPRAPEAEESRAIVLGEFGGLGLVTPGHMWQEENWGYEKMQSVDALLEKYENFYQEIYRMVENPGLSAVIYTQTTDVETETNGLMTYDRDQVKMGAENVARANLGKLAPRLSSGILQFTDSYKAELVSGVPGVVIRYTTDGSNPGSSSAIYDQPLTVTGNTTLKAVAWFPDGDSSRVASYELTKVQPAPATTAATNPGIKVRFYQGNWDKLPDFAALSPARNSTVLKPGLEYARTDKHFGLVFEGYLDVPETGVYQVYLSSDDGGRIHLDNKELIDYDGIHGAGEKSAPAALEKGLHPFRLVYFQREGGLGLSVSWEGPGLPKQEIGAQYWRR